MPVSLPGETWRALCNRVARADGPIAWSWAAARTNSGEWQLLAVCLRGATAVPDRKLRYGDVVVRSEAITPRAAASRLRRGAVGARGKLADALRFTPDNGQVFGQWCFSNDSMYLRATPWAHYYLHQRLADSISTDRLYEPLVARGQPYFPSLMPVLASLVFGVVPTALHNHTTSTLMVQLPDTRGRITSLQARDGQIVVGLAPAGSRIAGMTVHAAWRDDPDDTAWHHYTGADPTNVGEIPVPTDGVPTEMSIALLAPDGALLDQRGWSEQFGQPPSDESDLQGLATRWLAEGESATVEFKQDLNSDPARRSFAETIRAPLHLLLELDRATEPAAQLRDKAKRYAKAIPRSTLAPHHPVVILAVPNQARARVASTAVAGTGAPITVAAWSKRTERSALATVTSAFDAFEHVILPT
jgi:hypothetical protein